MSAASDRPFYDGRNAEYRGEALLSTRLPMPEALSIDIPSDIRAPGRARRAVERLRSTVDADVLADLKLLVSELITNSVKYGGEGAVTLNVEAAGARRVRVEVVDQGVGFVPVQRNRPVTEAGGWGLHLVQTLTNRWGVHEGSTHVWFEIDRETSDDDARLAGAR
jgi:anti-sigma regulatory factor (Ser/Thr protein kinase)